MAADDEELLRSKVGEAVRLLNRIDPPRMRRIQRDVRRIIIFPLQGTNIGQYWHEVRAIVLASSHVRQASSHYVACTIAHEATHARLRHAGIGYGEAIRARVERACVGQEIALARRFSNADEWVSFLGLKPLDEEYWSDAKLRERKQEAHQAWRARGRPLE
jgi:hypothetical protein